MGCVEIQAGGDIGGSIRIPPSKSLSNRALICAALAGGRSTLRALSDADDSRRLREALVRLGIDLGAQGPALVKVPGCGGRLGVKGGRFRLGNAGTSIRFLTGLLAAAGRGTFHIDGSLRMRERPMEGLAGALRSAGADIVHTGTPGRLPIRIRGRGLRGGRVEVAGGDSSQFLSSLLMAGALADEGIEIVTKGTVVSGPYAEMTVSVMSAFGVKVSGGWRVKSQAYRPADFTIEADAASAGYAWAIAAVTGGCVTAEGIRPGSKQPEMALLDALRSMGCRIRPGSDGVTVEGPARELQGIRFDGREAPDSVPTLAVVALFARGKTTLRGVAHLRHKESDRLTALAQELTRLGARVDQDDDGLTITPAVRMHPAALDPRGDHRLAMSFAIAGARIPGLGIGDPGCVSKSYPGFWKDLAALGVRIRRRSRGVSG